MSRFMCLDVRGAPLTKKVAKLLATAAQAAILYDTTEAQALTKNYTIDIKTEFQVQSVEEFSGIFFEATVTPSNGKPTRVEFLYKQDDTFEENGRPLFPLPDFLKATEVETDLTSLWDLRKKQTLPN